MNTQRAQWVLAEQPGREVLAVTDHDGFTWRRRVADGDDEGADRWHPADNPEFLLAWGELLVEFGPLDEAEVPR